MNFGYKVWLEREGVILGEGLYNLLIQIKKTGSISRAAAGLNMSYRSAWGKIKEAEKRWGVNLVKTWVGGETGGGAKLTGQAVQLINQYDKFRLEVDKAIKEVYHRHFGT
ncbi:winged helix-turn-helix domain-containing protein [Desulfolucanica intricata]|uniref:winged helix-turn-helix domain-containing protein n=1 Tax=Desulfolucanica intricata TaxID=1285191 RepID=UPI000837A296|nr:LysR family transcriptional regulator [Desulfolucanica intricata]